MAGSLAAVAAAHRGGAAIVRVHDVRETVDFLKVLRAIEAHRERQRSERRSTASSIARTSPGATPSTSSIVAFIIYYILALIRGTRAMQISIGLMLLGSTFFVARAFDLPALEAISRQILFYLPFAVIVLFQQEIRRALARMVGDPLVDALPAARRRVSASTPILDACDVAGRRSASAR